MMIELLAVDASAVAATLLLAAAAFEDLSMIGTSTVGAAQSICSAKPTVSKAPLP